MTLTKSVFIITSLCYCVTASALDFYVSPAGNDQATGLTLQAGEQGPFQTLARAQQAIRDLKKTGQFQSPITVRIAPGSYQLQKPLEFDIRDSGVVGKEIVWQGEKGSVLISGGATLPNCAPSDNGIWVCPVTGLGLNVIKYPNANRKKGNIPGFELFVNRQRLHLARWPDSDWAHIKIPLAPKNRFSTFEQLPPLQDALANAQVHIFAGNDWFDQYLPVSAADPNGHELTLAGETSYPLASGRRFYLQNLKSQLNAPGEWFYDKPNDKILFIPPTGEIPENVVASALTNLMTIKGASHIGFKNFSLQHSTGVAVKVDNGANLLFDNMEIANIGARAIEALNSANVTIANSDIHDTGEGGILLSGGDRKSLKPANNLVHNNHIHDFGAVIMTYTPAIEVNGVGSRITHNLIERSPGTGVLISGNDHLLEKNEVNRVCEQASDCGAIYSGRDWTFRGNIVRHNSIHDINGYGLKNLDIAQNIVSYSSPQGAVGVYLDDAISGFAITGNIFKNAGQMAIQLGGGRDNRIENNFFTTDSYAIFVDNRWPDYNWEENRKRLSAVPYKGSAWRSKYPELAEPMNHDDWPEGNTIRRNVIVSTKPNGLALRYLIPEYGTDLADNLVWSETGQVSVDYDVLDRLKRRGGAPWQDWLVEGIEKNSISADPCATINGNTVKFCSNSPVRKIGFQALPTDIGLIK